MEQKPPPTNASSWLSRRSPAPDERDTEIAKLKDRLGFYENFDSVIQENVTRAGELLRQAIAMRETAEEDATSSKQAVEQALVAERQNQRALLSGLLDEVTSMQVQFERIARKVADALDDVESQLPTSVDIEHLTASSEEPLAALTATAAAEHEHVDSAAVAETGEDPAPPPVVDDADIVVAETEAAAAESSDLHAAVEPVHESDFESLAVRTGDASASAWTSNSDDTASTYGEAIAEDVAADDTEYVFGATAIADIEPIEDVEADLHTLADDGGPVAAESVDEPIDFAGAPDEATTFSALYTIDSVPQVPRATTLTQPEAVESTEVDADNAESTSANAGGTSVDDATTEADALVAPADLTEDIAPEVTAESVLDQFQEPAADAVDHLAGGDLPAEAAEVAESLAAVSDDEGDAGDSHAAPAHGLDDVPEVADLAEPVDDAATFEHSAAPAVDGETDAQTASPAEIEPAYPLPELESEVIAATDSAFDVETGVAEESSAGALADADTADSVASDASDFVAVEEAAFDEVAAELEANAANTDDPYNLEDVLGNARGVDAPGIDAVDDVSASSLIDDAAPAAETEAQIAAAEAEAFAPVDEVARVVDGEVAESAVAETVADDAPTATEPVAAPPAAVSGGPSAWFRAGSQPPATGAPIPPTQPEAVEAIPPASPTGDGESSYGIDPQTGERRSATGELRNAISQSRPGGAPSNVVNMPPRGVSTVVLVHGVPRATTALSLKRYLEGLQHVGIVEPREYAEGILRLHVIGTRAVHIEDLRGWSDGSGLEPVHLREDLVEVRLPH